MGDGQCCGDQGGGRRWSRWQRLTWPPSTALSPRTTEEPGPGYLFVMRTVMQPNCSVRLPFYFFFLLSFWLGWWRTGRKCIPAKLPLFGLAGASFQPAHWPWPYHVRHNVLWFFFSTLKFKNLMPDIFLSLTVLENWSHSAAVLGPALHSQWCHWRLLDRRKRRLKSKENFLLRIVFGDYFWQTGRTRKITIKLILANSIRESKYSRGVHQASETWWQILFPD